MQHTIYETFSNQGHRCFVEFSGSKTLRELGQCSVIMFGCIIYDLEQGGGDHLSETPAQVAFLCLLINHLHIYFEIIVSGCRSCNSLTSCPSSYGSHRIFT